MCTLNICYLSLLCRSEIISYALVFIFHEFVADYELRNNTGVRYDFAKFYNFKDFIPT